MSWANAVRQFWLLVGLKLREFPEVWPRGTLVDADVKIGSLFCLGVTCVFIAKHFGLECERTQTASNMDLIASVSRVSNGLSSEEREELNKIVEYGKSFLKLRVVKLLQGAENLPIMIQYTCDCTPISVRRHGSHGSVGSDSRAMYVTVGRSGSGSHGVLFCDPVRLSH
eukprot:905133-Amphidinium_carterae.1